MHEAVTSTVCLAIEGLTKRFGGFYALNDLNMEVARGHIHALIGPNGAGKTTFFNLITGVLSADSGKIIFDGEVLDDVRPSKRTLRGIARTFQNIRLFPHLTVIESVMIGEHCRAYPSVWRLWKNAKCARARSNCLNFWDLPTSATTRHPICLTGNNANWKWRARLLRNRSCCCSTNRRPA